MQLYNIHFANCTVFERRKCAISTEYILYCYNIWWWLKQNMIGVKYLTLTVLPSEVAFLGAAKNKQNNSSCVFNSDIKYELHSSKIFNRSKMCPFFFNSEKCEKIDFYLVFSSKSTRLRKSQLSNKTAIRSFLGRAFFSTLILIICAS